MNYPSALKKELIESLKIKEGGIYVDCTFGTGGHAESVLELLTNGFLIAFEKDEEILKTTVRFSNLKTKSNFKLFQNDYVSLKKKVEEVTNKKIDGIYYDLGPSPFHFLESKRGFSFRGEEILDMRFSKKQKLTAFNVVNNYPIKELASIL